MSRAKAITSQNWFAAWRAGRKLNKKDACELLGINYRSLVRYEAGEKVPRTVALACAAVSYGLPPMGERQEDSERARL